MEYYTVWNIHGTHFRCDSNCFDKRSRIKLFCQQTEWKTWSLLKVKWAKETTEKILIDLVVLYWIKETWMYKEGLLPLSVQCRQERRISLQRQDKEYLRERCPVQRGWTRTWTWWVASLFMQRCCYSIIGILLIEVHFEMSLTFT